MRDASANSIFQGRAVHRPVEEAGAVVQPAEQAEVESINSSEVKAEQEKGNMVTRRTMTMERFTPSACPSAQQQQAPGRDQHPPTTRTQKRQHITDPPRVQEEAPSRTPPVAVTGCLVIREPTGGARPTRQLGSNVASSSTHSVVEWQTIFRHGNEPPPMTASVRT